MERRNRSAALVSRVIPYHPEYRKITGSVTAAILFEQLEYWFDRYNYNSFYKFLEPAPEHPSYAPGDSWVEELGFSVEEFRTAFDKIGVRYNSKTEFLKAQEEGRLFIKNGEEKLYCSFIDKQKNVTYYVRNNELVDRLLDDITHKEVEGELQFVKPEIRNEKAMQPDIFVKGERGPSPEMGNPNLPRWGKSISGDGESPSPEMVNPELPISIDYISRLHHKITSVSQSNNVEMDRDGLTDGQTLNQAINQSDDFDSEVLKELKEKYMLTDEDIKVCLRKMKGRNIRSPVNFLEKTIENYIKEKSVIDAVKKADRDSTTFYVPKNYFNSYSQRKYDVEELERKLLEQSMKREDDG